MKALTICQPYADKIARRIKTIENRTWTTTYRGELLIHAGKSKDWLQPADIADNPRLVFGAVVAIARIEDCVLVNRLPLHRQGDPYANGPVCWLLSHIVALPTPIPYRGAQGLWDVEARLETAVRQQLAGLEVSRP